MQYFELSDNAARNGLQLGRLAAAAGYSDGEGWWDALVESRRSGEGDVFAAVADAMAALREDDGCYVTTRSWYSGCFLTKATTNGQTGRILHWPAARTSSNAPFTRVVPRPRPPNFGDTSVWSNLATPLDRS